MWPTARAVGWRWGGVQFKPRQGRHKLCARAVAIMPPLPGLKNNLRIFLTPRLARRGPHYFARPLTGF